MILSIPLQPKTLNLAVTRLWNGQPCPDTRLTALVGLSRAPEGLQIRVSMPRREDERLPDAPTGTRVANLWEYDVVEVFFVGPGHRYLEVELGAGGHWLVLGFSEIRKRSNEYEVFEPQMVFSKNDSEWTSEIVIPWQMIPKDVRALNTFVIAGGQFLAHAPLPGTEPDFHQPDAYPQANFE